MQKQALPDPQVLLPCWYGQYAALAVDIGQTRFTAWSGQEQGFTLARPAGQPPILPQGWTVVARPGLLAATILSGLLLPGGTWWWQAGPRVEVELPPRWLEWARADSAVLLVAGDLRLASPAAGGGLRARASIETAVHSGWAVYGRAGLMVKARVGR